MASGYLLSFSYLRTFNFQKGLLTNKVEVITIMLAYLLPNEYIF